MNIVSKTNIIDKTIAHATKHLVGRTIVSVGYMTKEEVEINGWSKSGVIMGLDDGTYIYPLADDEGNNPGALDTTNEKLGLLGTVRL